MLQSTRDALQLYTKVVLCALGKACGGDRTASAGKSTHTDKRMTNAHKGRDHNTTYLCLHLNSCTIMHVCVK